MATVAGMVRRLITTHWQIRTTDVFFLIIATSNCGEVVGCPSATQIMKNMLIVAAAEIRNAIEKHPASILAIRTRGNPSY